MSIQYPRVNVETRLKWWIGCKSWKRFTPAQKKLIVKLRRENKSCTITWKIGRTHPEIIHN